MQLRTILTKLMLRGILAPESATYIASVPPATPIPPEVVRSLVAAPGANLPAAPPPPPPPNGSLSARADSMHPRRHPARHRRGRRGSVRQHVALSRRRGAPAFTIAQLVSQFAV